MVLDDNLVYPFSNQVQLALSLIHKGLIILIRGVLSFGMYHLGNVDRDLTESKSKLAKVVIISNGNQFFDTTARHRPYGSGTLSKDGRSVGR